MNRIKEIRTRNKISQQKLAEILCVHQTAVSQWETGRTSPDIEIAKKMTKIFGCSLDYLLGDEIQKNPSSNSTDYLLGRDTEPSQKENPSEKSEGIDETNIEILNVWSTLSLEQKEKALSYLHFLKQEDKENP